MRERQGQYSREATEQMPLAASVLGLFVFSAAGSNAKVWYASCNYRKVKLQLSRPFDDVLICMRAAQVGGFGWRYKLKLRRFAHFGVVGVDRRKENLG